MRGILFDKDGTLIDFSASWPPLYRALALELAGDEAGAHALLLAGGMDPSGGVVAAGSVLAAGNTIDIAKVWFPALAGTELAEMIARIDARFVENASRSSVPVPRLSETLATLVEMNLALGMATSDGEAAARATVEMLGLGHRLTHVFGYDSVPRPKPAPDMVHAFAEALGAEASDIVVVGDNTHDLRMARDAGAGASIGVLTGTGTEADLRPLADAVLNSIADLPEWLRTSGAH
jgi:phosphoglycolate phosphatase